MISVRVFHVSNPIDRLHVSLLGLLLKNVLSYLHVIYACTCAILVHMHAYLLPLYKFNNLLCIIVFNIIKYIYKPVAS